MLSLPKIVLPLLAIAHTCTAGWQQTSYVTLPRVTTFRTVNDESKTVTVTAAVTVSQVAVETVVGNRYLGYNGAGKYITINVTTTNSILPPGFAVPTNALPTPSTTGTPFIQTRYFVPLTVSNPTFCSNTQFRYTESARVSVPAELRSQATNTDLATLVTTYAYTSTDGSGKAVTTSLCDVFLHASVVGEPNGVEPTMTAVVEGGGYLYDCEDPRRRVCTGSGQNQDATGSGGCDGVYPPTAVRHEAAPTSTGSSVASSGEGAPKPSGAGSWRDLRERWGLVLPGVIILLSLSARC
ncbi:uncharacterized protein B0T15DRAFT_522308 [Chaetomium strumarium]|uniref:Uncharacterized protein n=1 Tax=Chaetomium strumarium TaxID=1170767 RepID=A0AAJ0M7A9_9PEZI|nr:hypothetical protein B0T15DRAFT_522308 [Chaetomium strumarium]